ncbi:MAG: class I SAM-dependent methyltransferase [Chitinophagaceae bacterium]
MKLLYQLYRYCEVTFLFILGKVRALFKTSRYGIKSGYRHRKNYRYFDDTSLKDEYQNEVYQLARFYADKYAYKKIADIGCGSAYKLMKYFPDLDTTGIDVDPTYTFLKKNYPDRNWIKADSNNKPALTAEIIICADVIEHVVNPDELLRSISSMQFELLFLSTPERNMARGWYDYGPPDNEAHVREWNSSELVSYISRYFDIVSHQITNIEQSTQLLICKKKKG